MMADVWKMYMEFYKVEKSNGAGSSGGGDSDRNKKKQQDISSIVSRLHDGLINILHIPLGKDLKKIGYDIRKDMGELEIVLKVGLHDLDIDLHKLVHNENLRSDKIVGNIRELGYKVPIIFKEDVNKLADLVSMGMRENEREILKTLEDIDKKMTATDKK